MKNVTIAHLFALSILVCTTFFLSACGQSSEENAPGPNASLSNEELLNKAVANMSTLKSFHMEIEKQVEGFAGKTITDTEHLGYSGPPYYHSNAAIDLEKSKSRESGIEQMVIEYSGQSLDPARNLEWKIIVKGEDWYESTDGGKSWSISNSEGPGFLAASLLNEWDWDAEQNSPINKALDSGLVLKDGSPRVEKIGGVSTRHTFFDMGSIKDVDTYPFSLPGTKEIHFWVSTDSLPTVRQIRIEGDLPPTSPSPSMTPTPSNERGDEEHKGLSFKYTWKWSRFNENFGEVKPPPTETVKSP